MSSDINFYVSSDDELVSANAFFSGAQKLLRLLSEVEKFFSDKKKDEYEWRICELKKSSASLGLVAVCKEPLSYTGNDVSTKVIEGLRLIETKGERPYYFSDDALNAAKDFALLTDKKAKRVTLSNNSGVIDINQHIVANVNKIMELSFEELSTIEGYLKMLSTTKSWYFNVYDSVTGTAVSCYFDEDLLSIAAKAINQRVSVSGIVSYNREGYPKSIRSISEFEILPTDDNLPSINNIINRHLGISGGMSVDEFMEIRRHGRS